MNLFDFAPLFDLAHGFSPIMAVGAFFPFLKKEKEATAISRGKLLAINQAAYHFLEVRGIENFKVYTIAYDEQPVVLIQVAPQKKLRFSNIIEIQIRKFIRDNLSIEVPAIFWRFKTDYSEVPGPEQADYEFDEQPHYPQDQNQNPATEQEQTALLEQAKAVGEPLEQDSVFQIPPHLAVNDLQVEEISMGEFDEFLKGASRNEKKDEQL
ncbi:MAG: hypothetical protein AUK53_10175 [Betaproteobacteria bacterium CG2_30_59_46]|nr:MAG: hypothetical protein AUK53_10175 [Betaproteobacteria bacterium CG2_30_59_46]PIQ14042.1 MAG: hypothetical protein COW70_01445 [Hydrogenophilales bacterium CG18_big_fil_WC_8_21_14_2_50_58_12]PIY01379.1 MAG: hypothetical protein COZ23_03445 [Hydrogenophilales bacterium CG_4_10_14_3_um_filter_58_23]PJB08425.1 MAG: hypothetical protein CO125_01820 [Hydrogenophilales bacterium CG_4_9_14_3_um_filter_59_35]